MMEILHPNMVENLNKKRHTFKNSLAKKKIAPTSRSSDR